MGPRRAPTPGPGRGERKAITEVDSRSWADDNDIHKKNQKEPNNWVMTLGLAYSALGIIYGDIGTSPLYTVASILNGEEILDPDDVVSVISIIFWTITLVVLLKYVGVVLHANDKGEGGTFALYTHLCRTLGISPFGTLAHLERAQLQRMAQRPHLARDGIAKQGRPNAPRTAFGTSQVWTAAAARTTAAAQPPPLPEAPAVDTLRWWNTWHVPAEPIKQWFRTTRYAQRSLLTISIVATSMVFGDGVLTPAVSVVSAVSGLEVAFDSVTTSTVVGVSCAILVLLFAFQYKGTARVTAIFSPIVAIWLICNAAIGIYNLNLYGAGIFKALSPHWIDHYFRRFKGKGWMMLGSVMLSVTGAEAMFADLGHFNIPSVVISFVGYVYPCLILTYLGQGAYLIANPQDVSTTYWSSVPNPVFWPMLILATLSSVVASQALISACFSICKQAKALGFCPKIRVQHTSLEADGQIYISSVNWMLMVMTIAVVAGFQADSNSLGQAYGLTISTVMFITTLLVSLMMVVAWRISFPFVVLFLSLFILVDGAFVSANLTKVPTGGWVSLAITAVFASIFHVWWAGQRKRMSAMFSGLLPQDLFTFTTVGAKFAFSPHAPTGIWQSGGIPTAMQSVELSIAAAPIAEATEPSGGSLSEAAGPVAEGIEPVKKPAGPSRDEIALLRGELNLALKIPGASSKPLATLPGISLFYSNSADTVPPVLCHFLRNCEAVHQINIFVCVRHLPIPYIDPADRLLVRAVPGIPSFYQSIVRYGYMESVDHGKGFVDTLITALIHLLEDRAGLKQTTTLLDALRDEQLGCDDGGGGAAGPVAEGVMDLSSPSGVFTSPFEAGINNMALLTQEEKEAVEAAEAEADAQIEQSEREDEGHQLHEITIGGGLSSSSVPLPTGGGRAISGRPLRTQSSRLARMTSLNVPFQPPRLAIEMSTLSRVFGASSLGQAMSQHLDSSAHSIDVTSPTGCEQLTQMAMALEKGDGKFPPVLEDSALRVSQLLRAADAGVVYYFGRTSLRMQPGSSLLHDILYESLYKPMLLLSYAENEAWHVPVNNLVELGMVVFI